jgi:hypothetical protein
MKQNFSVRKLHKGHIYGYIYAYNFVRVNELYLYLGKRKAIYDGQEDLYMFVKLMLRTWFYPVQKSYLEMLQSGYYVGVRVYMSEAEINNSRLQDGGEFMPVEKLDAWIMQQKLVGRTI